MASDPALATRPRPTRDGYLPPRPEMIRKSRLAELLPTWRTLTVSQQARLGFSETAAEEATPRTTDLWLVGDPSLVQRPSVAIVGTRNVSSEGAARARRLARELSEASVVVVSGLARGVDTEALTSAIGAGGHVVAVIGTPVTLAYPAENKRLQESIYRDHFLVSQFAPGARVFPGNFPKRNKLMAAISDATVIIEASDTSGTLHQAAECVRLGRWLFIAKSVLEDRTLTWPADFVKYPNTRTLTHTQEVLAVLEGVRGGH